MSKKIMAKVMLILGLIVILIGYYLFVNWKPQIIGFVIEIVGVILLRVSRVWSHKDN